MLLHVALHVLYPSQEHVGHESDACVAEEVHHYHKHLKGQHITFSYAGAAPWAQMVVVLDQRLAFAAIHGPRWPETSYLLVPEPSVLPGFFVDDPFEESRVSAANTKQSTQRYREYRNVDEGEPPREAGVAIENDKVAYQSRQNDDERDGNEHAEGPTRTSNDNGCAVRLFHQSKHSTDLPCAAAEPSIDVPAGIPRT